MCTDFTEVVDMLGDDESSYKFVFDSIDKALKDLPNRIQYASVETIVSPTTIGEVSCTNNNVEHVTNDPIVANNLRK